MLDHIGIPVSDLTVSRTFYARALAPLGADVAMESNDAVRRDNGPRRLRPHYHPSYNKGRKD